MGIYNGEYFTTDLYVMLKMLLRVPIATNEMLAYNTAEFINMANFIA